jgi:metal-responsive CopG/Arc/MetJ family transcriptional regulator
MSSTDYVTIKLPKEMVEKYIDPLVDDLSLGFSSRPEVIKAALRAFGKEYKTEEETD